MGETTLTQRTDQAREIGEARRRAALLPAGAEAPGHAVDALQQRANRGPGATHTAQLRAALDARAPAPLQRHGNGEPLPADLQAGLQQLSGEDVSSVNVFYDSPEPARYQAHAVTQGRDIHVAPGREGDVPHEAWHAVQQLQDRVKPTFDMGGVPVNDSPTLENEADRMGARALRAGRSAVSQAPAQRRAAAGAPLQRRAPAQFFLTPLWRGVTRGASLLAGAAYGAFQGATYGSAAGPLGAIAGGLAGGLVGGATAYTASGAAIDAVELTEFRRRLRAIRDADRGTATHQAFYDGQTRDLDALEHDIYTWLDENRLNPATRAFMPSVLNVLDGVQAEHQAVIGEVHQRNLNLWTPDRDQLGGVEQGRLQQAWTALRNGTGLIQGGAGAGQGPDELRAMHARLLSRPRGRELLYRLLDMQVGDQRNRAVGINFTPADVRTPQQKARVREYQEELKQVRARLDGMADTHPDYDRLIGRQMYLVGRIDDEGGGSNAASARALDKPNASIYGARGGSASSVSVRLGTRDSQDLAYDRQGRPNVSPAWLQYGHELIHAFHFRNAEDRGAEQFDAYRGTVWGDREEHHTIASLNLFPGAISENDLRAEHGITARYGHTGTSRDEWFGR
jgi:hypothetical protein